MTAFEIERETWESLAPADCPPAFLEYAFACTAYEPNQRPLTSEIAGDLVDLFETIDPATKNWVILRVCRCKVYWGWTFVVFYIFIFIPHPLANLWSCCSPLSRPCRASSRKRGDVWRTTVSQPRSRAARSAPRQGQACRRRFAPNAVAADLPRVRGFLVRCRLLCPLPFLRHGFWAWDQIVTSPACNCCPRYCFFT